MEVGIPGGEEGEMLVPQFCERNLAVKLLCGKLSNIFFSWGGVWLMLNVQCNYDFWLVNQTIQSFVWFNKTIL